MSTSGSPNIPKRRLPRRADLRGDSVETVHAGRSVKADLLRLDLGEGPMVVKDFGAKSWWVRLLGRLQISRESRAYRRLAGIEGVPAYFGRIDPYALVMESVEGRPMGTLPEKKIDGPTRFEKLARIVERIHGRGVLHLDLRASENALVTPDGRVFVIDFAAAMCFRLESTWQRWWFRRLQLTDRSALLKWKGRLGAGPLSAEEQRDVERHRRLRRLWVFNRKKRPER